jgi:hypothetical protein
MYLRVLSIVVALISLSACKAGAVAETPNTPSTEFNVRVLGGAASCEVRGNVMPCIESGSYLRDVLRVAASQTITVVVFNEVATADQVRSVEAVLRGAGFTDVKYLGVSFISQPGQGTSGS